MLDIHQVFPPRPHVLQIMAGRRVEPVPTPLDCDSDGTFSVGVRCEMCGGEDPGTVHVPCCNFAAHQHCVVRDADILCPYCGEDLQPVFDPAGESAQCSSQVGSGWFHRSCGLEWSSGGGYLHGSDDA